MIYGQSLAQQMNALANGSGLERMYMNYLSEFKVSYDPNLQKSLDSMHSIVSKLSVVGKDQVTFFDGNIPAENEHMIIFAIRLYESIGADLNNSVYTAGTETADLQSGKITTNINGVNVQKELPLLDFTKAEEEPYSGWIILPKPIIWIAQTPLKMQAIFDTAPATANQNLAMEVNGWKMIS